MKAIVASQAILLAFTRLRAIDGPDDVVGALIVIVRRDDSGRHNSSTKAYPEC